MNFLQKNIVSEPLKTYARSYRYSFGPLALVALTSLLTACGGDGLAPVAETCRAEIMRKGEGQNVTVDEKKLLAGITKQADGTYSVEGEAVLNVGTNAERVMPFTCIVQESDSGPSIIRAEFKY